MRFRKPCILQNNFSVGIHLIAFGSFDWFDWPSAWIKRSTNSPLTFVFKVLVKILEIYYSLDCCTLLPIIGISNMFSERKIRLNIHSGITQTSFYVKAVHWCVPSHNNTCCFGTNEITVKQRNFASIKFHKCFIFFTFNFASMLNDVCI